MSMTGVSPVRPPKPRAAAAILRNAQESARRRYVAAATLGRANTRAARNALMTGLKLRDPVVRAGVLKALGRIGDEAALRAITRLKDRSAQARFAAALIAHRLGVPGPALQGPPDRDMLGLRARASHPMQWRKASAAEVKPCLRSLGERPFGIALAPAPAYQVTCGGRSLMVLFDRQLAAHDMVKAAQGRKALAGMVARKNEADGLYSEWLLIFTAPARRPAGFRVLLYLTNGTLAFAGRAGAKAQAADFSIRAVSRPGAVPILVRGALEPDRVKIGSARSELSVRRARQPRRLAAKLRA